MVAFPLAPVPSTYTSVTPSQNHGVYYVGAAPSFTLNKSGATAYTVRDYWGTVVASGTVSGTSLTPAAPSGGWKPGWYRLYLAGPANDALFGTAYGSYNFAVIRNDARFPAIPAPATTGSEYRDIPGKGALGIGTSRLQIQHADTPTTGQDTLAVCQADATSSATYWAVGSGDPYYDATRPRYSWCQFPNGTVDHITVSNNLGIYCKNETIDGSGVTVTITTGTSNGYKITVNSETYDNIADAAAAVTAINATSSLVKAFGAGGITTLSATVIGRSFWNGVVQVVSTLYPLGVTRFEGPSNEPNPNAETAHQMRLFQAAVHTGNANAKAIGPCLVTINNDVLDPFFAAGGGAYCDEISFHAYNVQTNGDISSGRTQYTKLATLLGKYGLSGKTLWQTESTHVFTPVYGVYHPRRSRVPLLMTLLAEQFGLPRERNVPWYDVSHGFWSYPSWWENSDGSLNPWALLYRTLAEETFGQTHLSSLSFGAIGDHIFLGSLYGGTGGRTAVIVAQSYMPAATVTLTVTGATGTLTLVDGFGNTSTATISGGMVTVPVTDLPTYMRLPAGATVAVAGCNDWPANQTAWANSAAHPAVVAAGTVDHPTWVNDGQWLQTYGTSSDGITAGAALPDTLTLAWPTATRLDRVMIWCWTWQFASALIDFDIQTSNDGTTWTTRTTVTKSTPSSFLHGSNSQGVGCQYETYWDEQWIFDVKLPAPVTAKYVRINARASSYGGEPDAQAVAAGGQGNSYQRIAVQEVAVLCDDNTRPHYATIA